MATPPPRPPSRRPTPSGRPARPARPAPPKPGAHPGVRKAEKIRYTPAKIEESRWGRKAVIVLVAVAVVVGTIGWYRYLTRPPVAMNLPVAAPTSEAPEAGAAPAPTPSVAPAPVVTEPEPVTVSAREVAADLAAERELAPTQAFAKRYRDREVTWSGTVTSVTRAERLLKFDFKDSDGVTLRAWCMIDAELSPGATVTVRGKLAARFTEGFSIDRCEIL